MREFVLRTTAGDVRQGTGEYQRHDETVFKWAFDLIELDGDDLRLDPLEARKDALATLLIRAAPGVRLNSPEPVFPSPVRRSVLAQLRGFGGCGTPK